MECAKPKLAMPPCRCAIELLASVRCLKKLHQPLPAEFGRFGKPAAFATKLLLTIIAFHKAQLLLRWANVRQEYGN